MSRLYYPRSSRAGELADNSEENKPKEYLEKIAKFVPSEVIAVYVGLVGFVPGIKAVTLQPWFYAGAFVLCLALTPLYLSKMADAGQPNPRHLWVSTFAFVVWAYTVSGHLVVPQAYDPAIAGI